MHKTHAQHVRTHVCVAPIRTDKNASPAKTHQSCPTTTIYTLYLFRDVSGARGNGNVLQHVLAASAKPRRFDGHDVQHSAHLWKSKSAEITIQRNDKVIGRKSGTEKLSGLSYE